MIALGRKIATTHANNQAGKKHFGIRISHFASRETR
jgi:hypothetical protein